MMDLRDSVPLTRHIHTFSIPLPPSTASNFRNPDKALLRQRILRLRAEGKSYRGIATALNIHFTRVQQILKEQ
jgi:DNA invertase Pin-like site-specific DNA recombinase